MSLDYINGIWARPKTIILHGLPYAQIKHRYILKKRQLTFFFLSIKDNLLINHFHKIEKKRENRQTCISRQIFRRNKDSMATLTMRYNKKDY